MLIKGQGEQLKFLKPVRFAAAANPLLRCVRIMLRQQAQTTAGSARAISISPNVSDCAATICLRRIQFQQRQKRHHHFRAAHVAVEQFREPDVRPLAHRIHDQFDFFADRPFVPQKHPALPAAARPVFRMAFTAFSKSNNDTGGLPRHHFFKHRPSGRTRENTFLPRLHGLQLRGGILEFFIFHQLADQFPARVFPLLFPLRLHLLFQRQQFPGS